MWDFTLLFLGGFLRVTCPSQPRFLGGVLIATAALGMSLETLELSFIPWCVVSFTYISLHIFVVVLSPLQILWIKSKPPAQSSTGIVIRYEPNEDEGKVLVDIIAVHGLGSNPDWARKHAQTDAMWLRDFLPKSFHQARIMAFNHNSAWSMNAPVKSVEVCGEQLLNVLNTRRETEEALVTAGRENTDDRFHSIKESMIGAIFLGVPHDGSRLTAVGKLMSYTTYWLGSSTELLEALRPGDEPLRELNASFLQGYGRRDLINFFELQMTGVGQFPLLLAVDRNSSTFANSANVALEANHVGMNKYATLQDENYKLVLSEIKRIVDKIPSDTDTSTSGWLESGVNCIWVLGKGGSGKSTLLKHILERLNQTTQPMSRTSCDVTLSFFFSDRGGDLDKSEAGCLRSLQHQLLKQIPALFYHILPEYKVRKEYHAEVIWHIEDMKKMFLSMIGSPHVSSIRIVIDAIDECQNTSKFALLDFIYDELLTLKSTIRIFFTSRPDDRFSKYMKLFNIIKLEEKNGPDIESYINNEMMILGLDHPLLHVNALTGLMIERARGTFLWVKLVLIMLKDRAYGSTFPELEQVLGEIPEDLKGVYDQIYQELEKREDRDETKKILQWAMLAKRPLTVSELRWALSIDSSTEYASLASIRDCRSGSIPELSQMEARIRRFSGGLVEVVRTPSTSSGTYSSSELEPEVEQSEDEESGMVIQLIHQSLEEHLFSTDTSNPTPRIDPRQAQRYLARVCITTITYPDFTACYEQNVTPFLKYAAKEWPTHASLADVEGNRQLAAFNWPESTRFLAWHDTLNDPEARAARPYDPPCPYALVRDEIQMKHGGYEEWRKGIGSIVYPLAICLRQGMTSDIEFFLKASVSEVNSYFDSSHAQLNRKETLSKTAILAISMGNKQAVLNLIEHGADVDYKIKLDAVIIGLNFMGLAALYDRDFMIKPLLDSGVKIIGDYNISNPLLLAILAGSRATMEVLIANSADSASGGYTGIMQRLIALGANVNAVVKPFVIHGRTPLETAAFRGNMKAVQLLLYYGAKVASVGPGYNGSAVHAAAHGGDVKALQKLLPLYAPAVNSLLGKQHPLYLAAIRYHKDCMRELVKQGCFDVIIWNRFGQFYMAKRHMKYFDWESWMGHTWEGGGTEEREREDTWPRRMKYRDTSKMRQNLQEPLRSARSPPNGRERSFLSSGAYKYRQKGRLPQITLTAPGRTGKIF
ncbi:hypothetical protein DFP73DRAFT_632156 [Morchella snyderi]|nr:hypothetical protein DFP73DRAFT_632156 [Morchella snyderi]